MDMELLQRSLQVLVKRGKAQIFGSEDQQGVKFFWKFHVETIYITDYGTETKKGQYRQIKKE